MWQAPGPLHSRQNLEKVGKKLTNLAIFVRSSKIFCIKLNFSRHIQRHNQLRSVKLGCNPPPSTLVVGFGAGPETLQPTGVKGHPCVYKLLLRSSILKTLCDRDWSVYSSDVQVLHRRPLTDSGSYHQYLVTDFSRSISNVTQYIWRYIRHAVSFIDVRLPMILLPMFLFYVNGVIRHGVTSLLVRNISCC